MFLTIIIVVSLLTVYTYIRWETVSPKLIVREAYTLTGAVIGSTPEVARTTVKVVKAANAVTEYELRVAGEEGPVGFRTGRVVAAKATRDTFKSINKSADERKLNALNKLAELDAYAENTTRSSKQ